MDSDSYSVGQEATIRLEDHDLDTNPKLIDIYTVVSDPSDPAFGTVGQEGLGLYSTNSFEAFGRLLDITVGGERWTGLAHANFYLVETGQGTGVFQGRFTIPKSFFSESAGRLESTAGTIMEVNYIDFLGANNQLATVSDGATIKGDTPIWYVDSKANSGVKDGGSWATAFTNPQDALTVADEGNEIWIAAGTYTPDVGGSNFVGDRDAVFQMRYGVALYGGFIGTETERNERNGAVNSTILSGDLNGNDSDDPTTPSENAYHVVSGANQAKLDGFTIRGGNAERTGDSNGGGMVNYGTSPMIKNCIFQNNSARGNGGAMFNDGGGSPAISDCEFERELSRKIWGWWRHL